MKIVDARGKRCPAPILAAAYMLKTVNELTLLADDPATWPDLQAFARMRNCKAEKVGEHEFYLAKAQN